MAGKLKRSLNSEDLLLVSSLEERQKRAAQLDVLKPSCGKLLELLKTHEWPTEEYEKAYKHVIYGDVGDSSTGAAGADDGDAGLA